MARTQKAPEKKHDLSDRQIMFCHEYAKSLNASDAYRRAGYECASNEVASASSSQLLANPKVRAYLGECLDLTAPKIINEIAAIAFSQITDFVSWENGEAELIPSAKLSVRAKSAIKGIKFKRSKDTGKLDISEIMLHDKVASIEKLCRKFSLYPKEATVIEVGTIEEGDQENPAITLFRSITGRDFTTVPTTLVSRSEPDQGS